LDDHPRPVDGGHISVAALELYPDAYQGALIECGVIDGVGITDWRYAYIAAGYVREGGSGWSMRIATGLMAARRFTVQPSSPTA
jgi:hypothetical protein